MLIPWSPPPPGGGMSPAISVCTLSVTRVKVCLSIPYPGSAIYIYIYGCISMHICCVSNVSSFVMQCSAPCCWLMCWFRLDRGSLGCYGRRHPSVTASTHPESPFRQTEGWRGKLWGGRVCKRPPTGLVRREWFGTDYLSYVNVNHAGYVAILYVFFSKWISRNPSNSVH